MSTELVAKSKALTTGAPGLSLPALVTAAGERASRRFVEFFTANIRNSNTRQAYARAVADFCQWCESRGLALENLEPVIVAAYIEQHPGSPPTVKQHLAAIRMLFDWLVVGQVIPMNPAASVRGPKYVVKRGKTHVLKSVETRMLLDSIDVSHVVGLRDRALIGAMVFSFARVGAVVGMRVEDYYENGKRWWIRLHEKGGKFHEVPAHHNLEAYFDEYIEAAGLAQDRKGPFFRSAQGKIRQLTSHPLTRTDVLRMIKRRAKDAGLSVRISCHTFRATGITAYLENGGTLEVAQAIAAHESARTTKLYDRTANAITLDEIERIVI